MVVYNLCWVYSLSFWSTLSSHFGIGVNSVLCSGSLEHREHVISHFSERGILKVFFGSDDEELCLRSSVKLLQRKQSSFPGHPWGCAIPSVLTAPSLVIQTLFTWSGQELVEFLSITWSPTQRWQPPANPIPLCLVARKSQTPHRNSHSWIISFLLCVGSILVMQILQHNLYLFAYKYALNQSWFPGRCLIDYRLFLFLSVCFT